jgi:GH15 family glucan-1,4-alpha-glucosidase
MLLLVAAALSAEPHFSYPKLVTANGYGVAVLNGSNDGGVVLDVFSDHLYQQYSADQEPTRDLLYDSYFGARVGDESGWVTSASDYALVPGTNVIEIQRSMGDVDLTEVAFAPMEHEAPALVHLVKVTNNGAAQDVELFWLGNFHVGDTSNDNERAQGDTSGMSVSGNSSGLSMHFVPVAAPSRVDCTPNNPWYAVNEGWDLDDCSDSGGDDRVVAMQWSLSLGAGESAWIGVVDQFGSDEGVSDYLSGRGGEELLEAELAWWADWQGQGSEPAGLSEDERRVYQQALAFMKMGQVREQGDAYGQILASLPLSAPVGSFQHTWNISWVRDGAYAIRSLVAAGHYAEARDFLAFQIQDDKTGEWVSYVGGMEHALSICRIYGNGDEWTDTDETGPNIEFDNFGLYLWAFGRYVDASGDTDFLNEHAEKVFDQTADVLVRLVDPSTGLITADSSIWERHWNGNQKQFTYTSTWAVRGLREAAWMAAQYGDAERAATYQETANGIAAAIEEHLVRADGVLVGNLEEHQANGSAMDLAAVDAFNNGTLDPRSESFEASMYAWDRDLGVSTGPGFKRNDDGDLYDEQEWLMVDLRVAEALRRACRFDEAAEIEAWVTEHALENNLIIPELLDPSTADYAGPAPMMGFGSGLYVLQLHQRARLGEDCDPLGDSADTGPSGDSDDRSPGLDGATTTCGCSGLGAAGSLWLFLLPLLALRRRP